MKKDLIQKTLGLLVSNLIAFIIIWLNQYFHVRSDGELILSEFVIIPFLMGIICSWFWRKLNLDGMDLVFYSFLNALIALLMSALLLREGVICLIIVSPLILGFIIAGVFIGKVMFKKKNQNLNVSILSLLFIVFVVDSVSDHQYENKVSDELTINATPDKVWKNVVAFDRIKQPNNYWLFKIGLPSPMETTVTAYKNGAGRKCIFSNGYTFDEKIVAFDINKNLTFDIVRQPLDPEIMGHIDIVKGQFLLRDNGDGTTTLIGNSWYKLHVFPIWYYDFWAESIVRNVHSRVMDHIKILSEK